MSKIPTDPVRRVLNGPTMGTRWTALFHMPRGFDLLPVRAALQAAVDEVDGQMSTWRPDSDLMRVNRAPVADWVPVPAGLLDVMARGLDIGRLSGGAFDIGMGDAITAWGFGPEAASPAHIRAAMKPGRKPAHEVLDLDAGAGRLRKTAPITVDLNGIAKGYGADRLADALAAAGIVSGLVGIDGESRAIGVRPDGKPWAVALEAPDSDCRAPHSIIALQDAAVATSGDYRHWIEVGGRRLSHTMDTRRGAPLAEPPASVTVVAETCTEADAWATALMVLGLEAGMECASRHGLDALFLLRDATGATGGVRARGVGRLFYEVSDAVADAGRT